MKDVVIESVPVIDLSQLSRNPIYGVTMYRGVLVVWDEDHDPRVLRAVRVLLDIPEIDEGKLLAVHESQGNLTCVWRSQIPSPMRSAFWEQMEMEGDNWNVEHVAN